jgi:hypothetical protein
MTVVHYESPTPLPPSRPGDELQPGPIGWVARLRGAAEYAAHIAQTDFVPQALRGNPPAIAAAILYGAEVGLEPMQSLAKIAVIKGRPALTAEAMRSLVAAAGHELWIEESTATRCIAAGRRHGQERVGRVTWTFDDAKRAGIAGQDNWRRYPNAMLVARATATLARQMFADVIGGMAAAEELEDEPANGGGPAVASAPPPADAPPPPPAAGRTRRRRPAAAPEAAAAPEPAPEPEPDTEPEPEPEPAPEQPEPPPAPEPAPPAPEPARPPVTPTPPPDDQPTPPAPDPADEPPATDAQKRQLFALMRDVGLTTADRDNRLAYTNRVVGRELASSNELTIGEASTVIDDLVQIRALPPEQRQARLARDEIPY